jgi:TonB-linked SusC/RagA family outer membrane protein
MTYQNGCKIRTVLFCLALLFTVGSFAQTRKITGKVIADSTNEPVPGASIHVQGTSTVTTTGASGQFSLFIGPDAKTILVSSVGFQSKELPVAEGEMTITLKPVSGVLGDVVVIGYGTQKKREVTSAVTSVKPEDFNKGGARNALDLIQGKVAGLSITRTASSNPNSGVSIQLRAATSLTGSNSPLIVIDGIPGGNLDLLQQDDIASFDILKDGSAAAIYGTRANGGVILITTKKGRSGPPRYEYSTYVRKEYVARKPDFLTASQYRDKVASGQYPQLTQTYVTAPYDANTNMFDSIVNHNNLTNYHDLSVSGGTDKSNYRASVYYSNMEGITKDNSRRQYGARLSLNQKGLNGRLTSQIDLVTNFNRANLLGSNVATVDGSVLSGYMFENAFSRIPTLRVRDSSGKFYSSKLTSNPLSDLAQKTYTRDQSTNSGDAKFTLEIIRGLKASAFGSITRDNYTDDYYAGINSDESLYDGTIPGGGHAFKGSYTSVDYAFEPTLEYTTSIKGIHNISAIGGYSYQYHTDNASYEDNRGFFNDELLNNNIGAGDALGEGKAGMYSFRQDNKLVAFFGRVSYNYKDKYLFQAILRHEGSSRFGANNKWGNFPAVSAGWNITREDFMKDVSFLNDLKLRAGYGITGNSGIPNYQSLVTLGTGGQYAYPDGVYRQTYGPNRNPNPNLKWERKAELNIGVDFSMLKNRLSGSVDVFSRKTTDLLYNYNAQLPPYIQPSIYTNVGTLSSKGIELQLSGVVIQHRNFNWRMNFTASHASTKMVSLSNDVFKATYVSLGDIGGAGALGNAIRTTEGGAIGNFYGKRFAGFDSNGKWLFYKKDGKTAVPITQITSDDQTVIGNAVPKYYLSWTNSFTYKNWDFSFFFRGRFKYKILNTMDITYGNKFNLPNNVLNKAFTKYAQLNDTYQYSDFYLQPGGFLKLDNATIGYTFKPKTDYIHNLRLYISGNNLITMTKYGGNDPDFVNDTGLAPGIDTRGPYPSTRQFLIGLNLGF